MALAESYRPFASLKSTGKALMGLCNRRLPKEITAKYLKTFGLEADTANRVLKALEFLGFVDEDSCPTHSLKTFVSTSHQKRRQILTAAIEERYAAIFD